MGLVPLQEEASKPAHSLLPGDTQQGVCSLQPRIVLLPEPP